MGDSEITIARNYLLGAGGRFDGIDALPLTGEATTWSVQEANSGKPDYVTDSAAAGTAWATGHKTSNGRISTTAGTNQDLKTILEIAREQGCHRQCLNRRNHGRHASRAECTRQRSWVPGTDRHGQLPDRQEA
jgi:hypothetical protein